jgi:hypothetical protein
VSGTRMIALLPNPDRWQSAGLNGLRTFCHLISGDDRRAHKRRKAMPANSRKTCQTCRLVCIGRISDHGRCVPVLGGDQNGADRALPSDLNHDGSFIVGVIATALKELISISLMLTA